MRSRFSNRTVDEAGLLHFSYRRYLEKKIRDRFGLIGNPLKLVLPLFLQSVLAPVISTDGAVLLGSGIVSPSPETAARALIATLTLGLVVMGCAMAAAASARRRR